MLPTTQLPRRLGRVVAFGATLLIAAGLFSTFAPTVAFADDTDGISGAPANEAGADGRTRYSYLAAPGQTLDDLYVARNTGTTAQTLTVFSTDAYNTDDGGYGLLDTEAEPTDAGRWVSFADGATKLSIPLEPGATQVVPFTVTVPADASPGDHAAGLVISVTSPNGQLLVDRRVATRLYVRVPGDLQPALTISNLEASYAHSLNPIDGVTTVTYTVKNTGNVALGAHMVIGAKALFGIGAGELLREELAEMLPGATRTVSFDVAGVGQYGYLNPYVRLVPSVEQNASSPGVLREVSRDTVIFAMPWWLLIGLALAGLIWVVRRLRHRQDEKNAKAWIAYTEAEAVRKATESGERR